MKKITLLSIAILASLLLTYANTDKESNDCSLNYKFIYETEIEMETEIEDDALYNSIYSEINAFDLNTTIEEEQADKLNTDLYNDLLKEINIK